MNGSPADPDGVLEGVLISEDELRARVNDLGLITSWQSHYSIGRRTLPLDGTFSDVVWSPEQPAYYFDQHLWDAH